MRSRHRHGVGPRLFCLFPLSFSLLRIDSIGIGAIAVATSMSTLRLLGFVFAGDRLGGAAARDKWHSV
jgi:hypothetical protein